jgi:acetoin utilization protein AcuC
MGDTVSVPWDDRLLEYDFGHDHPLAPVRVELTMALARSLGVLDRPGVETVAVVPADDDILRLVHAPRYIAAVRHSAHATYAERLDFGFGTDDNPYFPGMHEAAARIVGASVAAARQVWTGTTEHAVNIAGGLHHAMRARASGFCVYNDPAVAIAWLLAAGARRVAYVDVDVHHGDGSPSPDDQPARASQHPVPRDRLAGRRRLPRGGGLRRERGPAAWDRGRGVAAGVRRRGAAAGAGLRAGSPGHPARL